ncbi:hypothetical protein IMF27_01710 [Pseudomonas sp. PCH199]|uniref:hypothetical protein n=1 Tax=unclassified Pseudomonas TaxID=196821 RepID=UPI000BDD1F8D|nr:MULTISPECIES: hypothetical protein [unclassified Pseudomonas]MCW8274566.1 hypothetical protein [Pseudomonas sp. PCH199]PAM85234.1 hypothetical protein CES87_01730 [Pseudomonas sp. ERMR1:02]
MKTESEASINEYRKLTSNIDNVSEKNILDKLSSEDQKNIEQARSERAETTILIATNGNFKGELKVEHWWGQGLFYCYSKEYRITRSNGQSGGNKANLDFNFGSFPNGQSFETRSGDDLHQTGIWLPYQKGGWIGSPVGDRVMIFVKFIFDKSGSDPTGANHIYLHRPS